MLFDPILRLQLLEAALLWGTALLLVVAMPWGSQRTKVDALAKSAKLPSIGSDPEKIPWVVMLAWSATVIWVRLLWL